MLIFGSWVNLDRWTSKMYVFSQVKRLPAIYMIEKLKWHVWQVPNSRDRIKESFIVDFRQKTERAAVVDPPPRKINLDGSTFGKEFGNLFFIMSIFVGIADSNFAELEAIRRFLKETVLLLMASLFLRLLLKATRRRFWLGSKGEGNHP